MRDRKIGEIIDSLISTSSQVGSREAKKALDMGEDIGLEASRTKEVETVKGSEDVDSLKKEILEASQSDETRIYKLTADPSILDATERLLRIMEWCGHVGASRNISFYFDGDGSSRITVEKVDGKMPKYDPKDDDEGKFVVQGFC